MVYDLAIIGGGPAGYNAAERAAQGGLKTLLFEKRALGGVCLNEGCIPSKALLNSAKIYDHARHSAVYGVTVTGAALDHGAVIARKNKVVKKLTAGVAAKLKKHGVTAINADAEISGKNGAEFTVTAAGVSYSAKNLLICAGSVPVLPPVRGLDESIKTGFALTNREILDLPAIPEKLAVVGGGVVGLEMAAYYASAGSAVTVVEMLDKIGGGIDGEISSILQGNLERQGVKFILGAKVTAIENGQVQMTNDKGQIINTDNKSNKNTPAELPNSQFSILNSDKVLVSVGRRAAAVPGIEKLGVATERGAVITDEYLRTNVPGVYAAGDVNGKSMLAHTAYREGEVAVNHMLGKSDVMRYEAIPAVIYTHPEAAFCGETEESAKKKGFEVKCATLPMMYSGRYMAENEGGDGICKLVAESKSGRVLGVHIIGGYASETIVLAALMIETEINVTDLRELVFPHPTCGEVIRELLFELK